MFCIPWFVTDVPHDPAQVGNLGGQVHVPEVGPQVAFLKVEPRAARPQLLTKARHFSTSGEAVLALISIIALPTAFGSPCRGG
jgi:hypothetical protein